jgi:hypothetical protein
MNIISLRSLGAFAAALLVSGAAMAQSQYDDYACRQYADAQVAPYRDQANANTVGSTIVGAGLGAALGAAIGGGRGAGIGAASGAAVGLGTGAANAQAAGYDLQQRYNAFYYQCMQSRQAPAYAPQPGYAQPAYGGQPGYGQPAYGQPAYGQPGYAPYGYR